MILGLARGGGAARRGYLFQNVDQLKNILPNIELFIPARKFPFLLSVSTERSELKSPTKLPL